MSDAGRIRKLDDFLVSIRQAPVIMGILNVTPDSFSDGGQHNALDAAVSHAAAMVRRGAAIIDIGGESTRPGFAPVSEEDELARVLPIIEALAGRIAAPISIDTTKPRVAREAVRRGAVVVNDIWGLQGDPGMADVVAETRSAAIVMHNRREIDGTIDIVDDVRRFFERSIAIAGGAGIPTDRLILDPGIGFGKSFEQNLACIRALDRFAELGLPVLVGLSRKSFIGRILDNKVEDRLVGTLAANMIALAKGASILRVHDVAEHQAALAIFKAVKGLPR
jgi:dihydropteroate synthase